MALTYFKRFRMEIDLAGLDPGEPLLPPGYRWLAWNAELLAAHAEAKYQSFRTEIDANVFPCLGDFDGCVRLMQEISHKEGFLGDATWLVCHQPGHWATRRNGYAYSGYVEGDEGEFCGTIQGVRDRSGMGAIQNLGIRPEHRGRGLGSALMRKALQGFKRHGVRRAFLEVTAQNEGAIRLYRRLGFSKARTVYKAVEVASYAI